MLGPQKLNFGSFLIKEQPLRLLDVLIQKQESFFISTRSVVAVFAQKAVHRYWYTTTHPPIRQRVQNFGLSAHEEILRQMLNAGYGCNGIIRQITGVEFASRYSRKTTGHRFVWNTASLIVSLERAHKVSARTSGSGWVRPEKMSWAGLHFATRCRALALNIDSEFRDSISPARRLKLLDQIFSLTKPLNQNL